MKSQVICCIIVAIGFIPSVRAMTPTCSSLFTVIKNPVGHMEIKFRDVDSASGIQAEITIDSTNDVITTREGDLEIIPLERIIDPTNETVGFQVSSKSRKLRASDKVELRESEVEIDSRSKNDALTTQITAIIKVRDITNNSLIFHFEQKAATYVKVLTPHSVIVGTAPGLMLFVQYNAETGKVSKTLITTENGYADKLYPKRILVTYLYDGKFSIKVALTNGKFVKFEVDSENHEPLRSIPALLINR